MEIIILILIIGLPAFFYIRECLEAREANRHNRILKEEQRRREEEERNKPQPTEWDIKKANGGTHPWIVNGRIDPEYIASLPDEEDSNTMETRIINEKPY